MPLYDTRCNNCGAEEIDVFQAVYATPLPCLNDQCAGVRERAWLSKPPGIVGDECDVTVRHGLCDSVTGAPRRFTSKAEMAREAKARGLVNHVEHIGLPGSDKNPHTTRHI